MFYFNIKLWMRHFSKSQWLLLEIFDINYIKNNTNAIVLYRLKCVQRSQGNSISWDLVLCISDSKLLLFFLHHVFLCCLTSFKKGSAWLVVLCDFRSTAVVHLQCQQKKEITFETSPTFIHRRVNWCAYEPCQRPCEVNISVLNDNFEATTLLLRWPLT